MINKAILYLFLLSICLAGSQALIAGEGHAHDNEHSQGHSNKAHKGGTPVQTMAGIMMNLNHYPNSNEKEMLQNIVKTSDSRNERIIAEAMINLRHKPTSADKAKLDMVMNDKSANQHIRDLAGIVYNLSHQPTGKDKKMLSAMMQ